MTAVATPISVIAPPFLSVTLVTCGLKACDPDHRLRFEVAGDGGVTPYLHVRADLWAKVTRAVYYDLVDIGEERVVDGRSMFGIASGGAFFAMADAELMREAH